MTTKLLAVDDSKTMRKVLEITFAGDKYDSTVVGSANEALQALHTLAPQIAVVDGALGATNGYDLCKQIKSEAPDTRVLLLSSKLRPYDEAQGSAAGVDEHFDKPFDSTKFLDKVTQLMAAMPAPAPEPPLAPPLVERPPTAAQRPPAPPARVSNEAPMAHATPAPAIVRKAPVPVPQPPLTPPPPIAAPIPARVAAPVVSPLAPGSVLAPGSAPGSVLAEATDAMSGQLEALGLTSDQVQAVLSLSREVVEQVVWEVVPTLAETLIKEEITRLTSQ